MKSRSTLVGALHPILFFAGVYVVVLMFSIFICSTIFYSCNTVKANFSKKKEKTTTPATNNNATVATIQ
jgi:hypothetical protein